MEKNQKSEFPDLEFHWRSHDRWEGIQRPYKAEDVARLRGSVHIEHTLARLGAEQLWELVKTEPYVAALGAMTGNQAMQQVKAGLKAIYVSGWQVAADNNLAGDVYPDQSLYPANSMPEMVRHGVTGYVAGYRDAADLGRWVRALLKDEAARAQMGRAARLLVESDYSPAVQAQSCLSLYQDLLAAKNQRRSP